MLAQGVKAQRLHAQDIPVILLRALRQEQAVPEIALIQHPVEEYGLSVQAQPGVSADLPRGHGAQGEIALRLVGGGGDGHGVEVGILRGPEMGVRHLQPEGHAALPCGGKHPPIPQWDGQAVVLPAGIRLHRHFGQAGGEAQGGHRPLRRCRLQPHPLPDAGHGGVPHPMGAFVLLAVGVVVGQGVHRLHLQAVFPLGQHVRNVRGKGQVTSLVAGRRRAVHPHLGRLVHRTEVKQHPPFLGHKALGKGERRLIAQHLPHLPRPACQGGLGRPGQVDGPSVQCPSLVQGIKAAPPELGAGVVPIPSVIFHRDSFLFIRGFPSCFILSVS